MSHTNAIHVLSRGVIVHNNHILLAFDPQTKPFHYYDIGATFYYLPGGHVDHHESAQNALRREIEEETGIKDVNIENFLGILEHTWSPLPKIEIDAIPEELREQDHFHVCHDHEINIIFKVEASFFDSSRDISQQEDHVAFHWVPLKTLKNIDLRPKILKELLPLWLENISSHSFASLGFK